MFKILEHLPYKLLCFRVSQLSDVGFIARETDCLPSFIRKGIAMSCFYYARCLHEGAGAKKDEGEAKRFYSRVSNGSFLNHIFASDHIALQIFNIFGYY